MSRLCIVCLAILTFVFGKQLSGNPLRLPSQSNIIPGYVLCECLPIKHGAPSSPIVFHDSDHDSALEPDEDEPGQSSANSAPASSFQTSVIQLNLF